MTWNPFKKKEEAQAPVEQAPKKAANPSEKKGRPTPKMKQAQAAGIRPLVPVDRKASAKAAKARLREKENAEYEAMQKGDINHMPKAERLPWRIYIRDYVDARFNLGEWFIPVAFAILIVSMFVTSLMQNQWASIIMMALMYGYLIAVIIDVWLMWRKLKAKLIAVRVQGLPLLLLRLEPFDSDASLEASQAALPEARSLAGRLMSIYTLAPLVEGLSRKENSPVDCF